METGNQFPMFHKHCHQWNVGTRKLKKNVWHLSELVNDQVISFGETDHKPLVPMLTTHSLDQLPPRVQRLTMRLMKFNIKCMVHVSGKQMYTSDTLSRLQCKQPDSKPEDSLIPDQEMSAFVCSIVDTSVRYQVKANY